MKSEKVRVEFINNKGLPDPKENILSMIVDLNNKFITMQKFLEQQNMDIIKHIEHDSLSKMEETIIHFMIARGKFSFAVKKLFYYDQQHFSAYVQTRDNEFYRIEVKIDDFLNFDEKKFENEKEFYCSLSDELIAYADRLPTEMKKKALDEAIEMRAICK